MQTAGAGPTRRRAGAPCGTPARWVLGCMLCGAIAAGHAPAADAEIFKCKTPDGRILYSDSPCPGGGGEILPDESLPLPVAPPAPPAPAERNHVANGPAATRNDMPRASGRYEMSANERQRIVNLEQMQRAADNGEKRQAAHMEIVEIQRGTVARMSYEDLRRKDGYWVDLGNLERRRRIVAVQQLTDLFAAYQ